MRLSMSLMMVLAGMGAGAPRAMAQCDDEFLAGTPTYAAHFGFSVAISGDTIVAGAPSESTSAGYQAGRGYVFIRQFGYPGSGTGGGYWTQQRPFDDPVNGGTLFGYAVAILGNTAIFGDGNGFAYVTNRSDAVWSTLQALSRSPSMNHDGFGGSAALTSLPARTVAVVGASEYADETGAAFVFTINSQQAGTWTQTGFLQASDAIDLARFGDSVAAFGSTVAIGAPGRGGVYIFTGSLTGTNWIQQAKITAFDAPSSGYFGARVALSGDTLAILDLGRPGPSTGGVYVYVRAAGVWSPAALLLPRSPGQLYDTVALDGDQIAVTSVVDTVSPSGQGGFVDIYARPTGSGITGAWSFQRAVVPSDALTGDVYVALSGDVVVIGSPYGSPLGVQYAGELHAVTLAHPCPADFNCTGGQPNVADLFAFLSAWFAHDFAADFNGDHQIMVNDIFAFLSAWFAGC